MRKIYITEDQLNELINSDLMLSTETTPDYEGDTVSTTEPIGDGDNYGDPPTTDDKAKAMMAGAYQRMTTRGMYGGSQM
jgi:hypothetical protein